MLGVRSPTSAEPTDPRVERAALAAFVVVVVGALLLYEVVGHAHYWFFHDEWDFLAQRNGASLDLLRPHNEHWSTTEIVIYRVLFRVFGLRTYVPYQTLQIALHLTVGILLRILMRRVGVRPWTATFVAAVFVLIGAAAWENIFWAAEIGFVGSLACGLAALILVDHDGPFDRRDAAALAFGVVGLMSSGVGVTMAIVVGFAVLIRRGARLAFVHTAPLAALYAAWWVTFGRTAATSPTTSPSEINTYVTSGLGYAFDDVVRSRTFGVVVVAVLVVGLALAWAPTIRTTIHRRKAIVAALLVGAFGLALFGALARRWGGATFMVELAGTVFTVAVVFLVAMFVLRVVPVSSPLRSRAAAPVALLAGAVVFITIAAIGRAEGHSPHFPHYVHVEIALVAPALAIAVDAFSTRWRMAVPVLVLLLVVGLPRNLAELPDGYAGDKSDPLALFGPSDRTGDPGLFLAFARSPNLDQIDGDVRPFHRAASFITAAWLREVRDSGRLPDGRPTADQVAEAAVQLDLERVEGLASTGCRPLEAQTRQLNAGDSIGFVGALIVQVDLPDGGRSSVRGFSGADGFRLRATAPLTVELTPYPGTDTTVCE